MSKGQEQRTSFAARTRHPLKQAPANFNTENMSVKQFHTQIKDKTITHYFVAHANGMAFDGSNPTPLYR